MGASPARRPIRCDTWANPEQLVGTTLDGRYQVLRVLGLPVQQPTPLPHISPPPTGMGVSNAALLTAWVAVLAGGVVLGAWLVYRFLA